MFGATISIASYRVVRSHAELRTHITVIIGYASRCIAMSGYDDELRAVRSLCLTITAWPRQMMVTHREDALSAITIGASIGSRPEQTVNSRGRFFFSSRRRHTRSLCDWSSDVCSSD